MKAAILVLAALLAAGCTNQNQAERALKGAGYREVEFTGYRIFGCGEHDMFHDGFSATGPGGDRVDGVVCSGALKGATIRTD